jgi:hypothetical protein
VKHSTMGGGIIPQFYGSSLVDILRAPEKSERQRGVTEYVGTVLRTVVTVVPRCSRSIKSSSRGMLNACSPVCSTAFRGSELYPMYL